MPQPSRLPHPRTRRHANRNLGLIVVAYILYGALLFGTSAIVAEAAGRLRAESAEHSGRTLSLYLP